MWRKIVKIVAIIMGVATAISGVTWAIMVAFQPEVMLLILISTPIAVLVTMAPMMLLVEISEDIEDLRGEIKYLQEKTNKTETKISNIEGSKEKPPVERIFSENSRMNTRSSSKRPGDWTCKRCGKTNQAVITRCSCGAAKGEI